MYQRGLFLLRQATNNPNAQFHQDQWPCIEALLERKRLLVMQKTGWGKSMVYFLATKLMREQGAGPSIIISPLLALMHDQVRGAEYLGVCAVTVNSHTRNFDAIVQQVRNNEVDAILIAPEQLSNQNFVGNILSKISSSIGLFVVDEAHCISDWGHDFRPDYRRISRVIDLLPSSIAILATTATANNRVVTDIRQQLGQDLLVYRGSLMRESLYLQNIVVQSQAERLAWLTTQIPNLAGSGIIYTLTIRDAERVASFLQRANISAHAYHSELVAGQRVTIEQQLMDNEITVVVATVALGMGFDKKDLGFVIHFQRPQSLVHYYQQIGRAGRAIDAARVILLSGDGDNHICSFFINSAFPPQLDVQEVLNTLAQNDGVSINELMEQVNLPKSRLEHILKFLAAEESSPVYKEKSQWFADVSAQNYSFDSHKDKVRQITNIRQQEQSQVTDYIHSKNCLMNDLQLAFDEQPRSRCGKCANCAPHLQIPVQGSFDDLESAKTFLDTRIYPIKPKKKWPDKMQMPYYGFKGKIESELVAQPGRALALWRDLHFGELVVQGKEHGRFGDVLLAAGKRIVENWPEVKAATWVTYVPSASGSNAVQLFAKELAQKLDLPFYDVLGILDRSGKEQKLMSNSHFQAMNLDGRFEVFLEANKGPIQSCILVDDVVASGWTMTVCSALLAQAGVEQVFPLALALNSSRMD